ncbi:hypothetical protein [Mycobacterium sp.]|uniref:hypothetical protein n=1 Tax=Mycobacterium sp. TaxID=1785 RepID=UPI002C7156E9|nr:hypothetical protein [Mycobacterium sp.]HTY30700.1 hypothetical protein [Mycobacterium sp.]
MSIATSRPKAVGVAETVGALRPAILPAAVFIVVEILLAAETIWVILLKGTDPRSPAAAPLAILLSVALLANLGLLCGAAAAIAAETIRRSNRALGSSIASVGAPETAGGDVPAADLPRSADAEDSAAGNEPASGPPGMPASG